MPLARPMLDCVLPDREQLQAALREHLEWALVPIQALGGESANVLQRQLADDALANVAHELHTLQHLVDFGRKSAFLYSSGVHAALIGGEEVRVTPKATYDKKGDLQTRAGADGVEADGDAPRDLPRGKRGRFQSRGGGKKAVKKEKSVEEWEESEAKAADHSQLHTLAVRGAIQSTNVLVPDVVQQLRSTAVDVCRTPVPGATTTRTHTAATAGGVFVVLGPSGLDVYSLQTQPAREPRPAEGDAAPDVHLPVDPFARRPDAAAATSAVWRASDLAPRGTGRGAPGDLAYRPAGRARLTCQHCIVDAPVGEGGDWLQHRGEYVAQIAVEEGGDRVLLLQRSPKLHKSWRLYALRMKQPGRQPLAPPRGGDIVEALQGGMRFQAAPLDTSGREIAARYSVLITAVHAGGLLAVVCPDATTAARQVPRALRVYRLDLQTLSWSLQSPAPCDGADAALPIPRSNAATCRLREKLYVHGGISLCTGHGCLNDLWTFDMSTGTWAQEKPVVSRAPLHSKLACPQTLPIAAQDHAMAARSDGTLLLCGGLNQREGPTARLQALVPLVKEVPGGTPEGAGAAAHFRMAPIIIGLARCRAQLAKAVLRSDRRVLTVKTLTESSSVNRQDIRAPLAVLLLYSLMLQDMAKDGVFDIEDDAPPQEQPPCVVAANPRHEPDAVQAALRWALGLITLLAADVHTCVRVFEVADYFMLAPLRLEALSVICYKADAGHLPVLRDLRETLNVHELDPCIQALQKR